MSARGLFHAVGTAVGGLIGWTDEPAPAADPAAIRALFADLGVPIGARDEDLTATLRHFQTRAGLTADGVAGPRTVHSLAGYAKEARELRHLEYPSAA